MTERYDPSERAKRKQEQRDLDAADLASGAVTLKELRERNALIPADIAKLGKVIVKDEFE
jgi:hypothetical protein